MRLRTLHGLFFFSSLIVIIPAWGQPHDLPASVTALLTAAHVPLDGVSVLIQPLGQTPQTPLVAHNIERPMNPASAMKLITSAAALDLLGSTYTWKTRVYSLRAPNARGVLANDLYFQGNGDPSLDVEKFWRLLRDLRARGVRDIRGDVILDRRAFAPLDSDSGAFDGTPLKPQNTLPDALLLQMNSVRIDFLLRSTTHGKSTLKIVADTPAPPLTIRNKVQLVGGACDDWRDNIVIDYQRISPAHTSPARLTFSGRYATSCGDKRWYFSLHPQHNDYFSGLFAPLWRMVGGRWQPTSKAITHQVRDGAVPDTAQLLLEHRSAPLSEVLREMNKFSNNVMARQVFLTLARMNNVTPATPQQAATRVAAWLHDVGIHAPELVLDNGSGLSREARISAAHLGALLDYAWHRPTMPEFLASLSILGRDGTTRRRYENNPAAGQAHVKTGSLDGVRSLVGYVRSASGQRYLMVWMVNHPQAGASHNAQEALLEWLYRQ